LAIVILAILLGIAVIAVSLLYFIHNKDKSVKRSAEFDRVDFDPTDTARASVRGEFAIDSVLK